MAPTETFGATSPPSPSPQQIALYASIQRVESTGTNPQRDVGSATKAFRLSPFGYGQRAVDIGRHVEPDAPWRYVNFENGRGKISLPTLHRVFNVMTGLEGYLVWRNIDFRRLLTEPSRQGRRRPRPAAGACQQPPVASAPTPAPEPPPTAPAAQRSWQDIAIDEVLGRCPAAGASPSPQMASAPVEPPYIRGGIVPPGWVMLRTVCDEVGAHTHGQVKKWRGRPDELEIRWYTTHEGGQRCHYIRETDAARVQADYKGNQLKGGARGPRGPAPEVVGEEPVEACVDAVPMGPDTVPASVGADGTQAEAAVTTPTQAVVEPHTHGLSDTFTDAEWAALEAELDADDETGIVDVIGVEVTEAGEPIVEPVETALATEAVKLHEVDRASVRFLNETTFIDIVLGSDGKRYILAKAVCEQVLQASWENQRQYLQNDLGDYTKSLQVKSTRRGNPNRLVLEADKLPAWIMHISSGVIAQAHRERVLQLKNELAEALAAYTTQGAAANPRFTNEEQHAAVDAQSARDVPAGAMTPAQVNALFDQRLQPIHEQLGQHGQRLGQHDQRFDQLESAQNAGLKVLAEVTASVKDLQQMSNQGFNSVNDLADTVKEIKTAPHTPPSVLDESMVDFYDTLDPRTHFTASKLVECFEELPADTTIVMLIARHMEIIGDPAWGKYTQAVNREGRREEYEVHFRFTKTTAAPILHYLQRYADERKANKALKKKSFKTEAEDTVLTEVRNGVKGNGLPATAKPTLVRNLPHPRH